MAANIRDIVNQAYQLAGIIAHDEVADGMATNIGVIKLNEILAQLNIDQLFPYSRVVAEYTITESKHKYYMGFGNGYDIQYDRPSFINRITYAPSATAVPADVQQMDLPDIIAKTSPSTGFPRYFSVNPTFPNVEIYFDIKPQVGTILRIVYNKAIEVVDINSRLAIPPEYNSVLVTALSREVSVLNQMPMESLARLDILYKDAISSVKRNNSRVQIPLMDDLLGSPMSSRNIYNMG